MPPLLLLLLLATGINLSSSICPDVIVPIEDIQNAVAASKSIYNDNTKVGTVIPGTGFIVTVLEQEHLYEGSEGLRIMIAEKGFTTIVTYRGTDGVKQLFRQFWSMLRNYHGKNINLGATETGISAFVWNAFELLLLPQVTAKLKDQSRKYILTGHSLGGALASILSIYQKVNGGLIWENPRSSLITFGEPRVGDKRYALLHDKLINPYRKLRFVKNLDPVPHIPFWPASVHHSREIWMTTTWWRRKRYWEVCAEMDPFGCSNKYVPAVKVSDHSMDSYKEEVMSPPGTFYDRKDRKFSRWGDAMKSSCRDK